MRSKILSRSDRLTNNNIKQNSYRPLALAIALAFSSALPSIAHAATYTVSNTDDSGAGSLRRAVFDANLNAGPDDIEFSVAVGSTIELKTELLITDSVTIKGPVAGDTNSIFLSTDNTYVAINRHINAGGFSNNSGQTITLENITLQNGFFVGNSDGGGSVFVKNADLILNHTQIKNNSTAPSSTNTHGGGVFVSGGNVTLNKSIISGNSIGGSHARGGGLYVYEGNATLNQSTVSGNSTFGLYGWGGGLSVRSGNSTLTHSTISDNSTAGNKAHGGGVFVSGGNATLTQSTISGNSTSGDTARGGGLYLYDVDIAITHSTISDNSTTGIDARGGGLYIWHGTFNLVGNMILTQSTVVNNSSVAGAGGISTFTATNTGTYITLSNSILSGNSGPAGNFYDSATTPLGLLNVNTSLFGDPLTEINGTNSGAYFDNTPDLGPLQHNGGMTQTHKPNITSNVINTGDNTAATAFSSDQRGADFPRIVDAQVDMGAVELQNVSNGVLAPLNPFEILTRRDMAREILKKIEGPNYQPPLATGNDYDDVKVGDINADWIEEFNERDFTEGCAPDKFCPDMIVTKEQMAKVYIKAKGIIPPAPNPNNTFQDVPGPGGLNLFGSFAWESITRMRDDNYSTGCTVIFTGTFPNLVLETKYCPKKVVNREWFDLLLSQLP